MVRRVVVTGVGMATSLGVTTEESWRGLIAGHSGTANVESWASVEFKGHRLPVTVGAEIKGFDPELWLEQKKDAKRMDRFMQLGMCAAHQAWVSSGLPARLEDQHGDRAGCIVGVGIGGLTSIIEAYQSLVDKGPRRVSPFFVPMAISNLLPGHIAIRYNLRSMNWSPASACSSGNHGIGEAFLAIRHGRAELMVAGGAESAMHPLAVAGFASMHALTTTSNDRPHSASRPFDRTRDGFVMGEGAGVLVLEEMETAKRRGATIYCEIVGYGASDDAHHITAPPEGGEGAQRAMREALVMGGLSPEDVGYINAHGTSTQFNDKAETDAIKAVFGSHAKSELMVSSTKSMTGHLLGGAGGVEGVITALAIYHAVLPPTINLHEADPACDLDYIAHQARGVRVKAALSNNFGFGGTNAVLAFRRV